MVQTLKAYKSLMETNPKSLQKQHGHKHKTQYIEKHLKYININQSIIAKQNQEFMKTLENYK